MKKLEIACFNKESALIAQNGGADRIEFCSGILEGGTTPDYEETKLLREKITIDLYVMIRPRGGDFVYTENEFRLMKHQILKFKEMGVNGFVFGILNRDNTINIQQNMDLVTLARPLPCTFHRAFDEVINPIEALESVISCGFSTILTSGTKANVVEGMKVLKSLVEKAGNRIVVMPGGGLRSSNARNLKEVTNAGFYHSSSIIDDSETANIDEIKLLKACLV